MNNIILTKESSNDELKAYFNAVFELSKSDNEFPINLNEVWMLVYPRKDHAVRELTGNDQFMEGVDYQVFLENGENPNGGRPSNEYYLTVSCMEYLIARKVRPVFEVYRKVFHKTAQKKPLSHLEILVQSAQALLEQEQRLTKVEEKLEAMEQERIENTEKLLAAPISEEKVPDLSLRDNIRQLVNQYSASTGITHQDVWHKVYNQLYFLYHINLKAYKKIKKSETYLEVAERNLLLDKLFIIISNMIQEKI